MRRGLSTGVCFAGTAVGGLILPFILSALLSATTIRNTLLIVAPTCAAIILAVSPFLKPRAPRLTGPRAGRRDRQAGTPVLKLMRDRSFILFTLANFLQGLAYCASEGANELTRSPAGPVSAECADKVSLRL